MAVLNRDQILQSKDIVTREVDAHEWGSEGDVVLVRAMTLKEANQWRKSMLVKVKSKDRAGKVTEEFQFDQSAAELANAWMISIACVDEQGNRVFKEEDVAALAEKSVAPITRIVKVIMKISGL